jgi:predicted ATPase/DNA-binding SARP family transcriptional activator
MSHVWSPPGGVPAPVSTLIGRAAELADSVRLLQASRLLTLTGAGGSGKTRLALEIAAALSPQFQNAVGWIELTALSNAAQLAAHVATTLGLPEDPERPSLQVLVEALRERHLLIVLDNCEHVVDAAAELAEALLRGCPKLSLLATSREALGIAGERTWLIPLLSIPTATDAAAPARAALVPSVQLFVERAQSAVPAFQLSAANVGAVVDICRRLDGMPLAIELAAARVKVLAPDQIAARLYAVLALAPTNARGVRARHRTLRETIAWSCRMLSPAEQALFERLSVFAGSFGLEAVEAIGTDDEVPIEHTVDLMSALVDKSLVLSEQRANTSRFRLLETMRQYAGTRLEERGDADRMRHRMAAYYVAVAESAEPRLFGGAHDAAIQTLIESEEANIRAVEEWARLEPSRCLYALRIGASLHWFWFAHGRFREGRSWLEGALAHAGGAPPLMRARALIALGHIAIWQGDAAAIRTPLEQSLALLSTLDEPRTLVVALAGLSTASLAEGNLPEAAIHIDQALALLGGDESTVLMPFALYWRGMIALQSGQTQIARESLVRAIAVGRALGHRPAIGHPLYLLGLLELSEGDQRTAAARLTESLLLHQEIGDRWGMFQTLATFARAACEHNLVRAGRLLGASEAMRSVLGVQMPPALKGDYDRLVDEVRSTLGDIAFADAVAAGRAMSLAEAVAYAIEPIDVASADPDLRVVTLGPVEVFRGGMPIAARAWGSAKARELFLLLLGHRAGCTKDRAAAALWPDATPAQVRNNFHVTLHRIRKALGDADWVIVDNDRYALNPAFRALCDADQFEADARTILAALRAGRPLPASAAAVVARYRGEFLEHEDAGEWHLARRESLQQLYCDLLLACGKKLAASGRDADSVDYFRRLIARDAAHEDAARGLITAYARLGDRASARRAFEQLVVALRSELDVEPEPKTVDAYRQAIGDTGV